MIHLKAAWKQISTLRQCPSAHRNSWVTLVLAATHCLDGWCWSFFSCLDQFRKVFLSMTILFGRGKLTIQMTHVGETYSIQDHWGGCRCLWLLCLCFNHALSIAGNLRMGAFSVVWNSMKGYVLIMPNLPDHFVSICRFVREAYHQCWSTRITKCSIQIGIWHSNFNA